MKIRSLLLAAILSITSTAAYATTWVNSGAVSLPANNAVLLDSGALNGPSTREWCIVITGTVAETVELQHRDSANTSTVGAVRFSVLANDTKIFCTPADLAIVLDDQERVRVVQIGTGLGTVHVSLWYQ